MIRVITNFKKATGKSAEWCSEYYRKSHVELARNAFSQFPSVKKFSVTKVLNQMEVIRGGKAAAEPEVLWFSEIYFDSLRDFEHYLQVANVNEQIEDDRRYASEVNVYVCLPEEVILGRDDK